jgi:GAF domain-containing protein
MFTAIKETINSLKQKENYLDADWEKEGHPLLDFYVKIMPMVLNAERCSIFIHDEENTTTWLKVGTGLQERDIEVTGEHKSVVGKVISSGKAEIVSDLDKQDGMHQQLADKTGFVTRDILCVPIMSLEGDKVMGAVQLLNKKDGTAFNDDDLKLLNEMAHYLELTIENIYFNQEITGILDTTFNLLEKITFILVAASILLVIFLSFGLVGYVISLFG